MEHNLRLPHALRVDAVYIEEGDRVLPSEHAAGPWNPNLQHGGAVAALLARAVERQDDNGFGRIVRLSIDLMRPIPLSPMTVSSRTVRSGRRLRVLEAIVSDGNNDVARATAMRLRTVELALPSEATAHPEGSPLAPDSAEPFPRVPANPFFSGIDARVVVGRIGRPGPVTAWFRLRRPIVAGESPSPLMRLAAVADFANGISSVLDLDQWSFVNADVTVWCYRHPLGEWVALESRTVLSDSGIGCTHSSLFDTTGHLGWSAQSLLVGARS